MLENKAVLASVHVRHRDDTMHAGEVTTREITPAQRDDGATVPAAGGNMDRHNTGWPPATCLPASALAATATMGGGARPRIRRLSDITATSNAHVPCRHRAVGVVAAQVRVPDSMRQTAPVPRQCSSTHQGPVMKPTARKKSKDALRAAGDGTVQAFRCRTAAPSHVQEEQGAVGQDLIRPATVPAAAGVQGHLTPSEAVDHAQELKANGKQPQGTHGLRDVFRVVDGVAVPLNESQTLRRCTLCECAPPVPPAEGPLCICDQYCITVRCIR